MAKVYSIPEQALRSLPLSIPCREGIKISNFQSEVIGYDDPTPSTFYFTMGSSLIIWQVVNVVPIRSDESDRTFYCVSLEQGISKFRFWSSRCNRFVTEYMCSLGAKDTGSHLHEYLEEKRSNQQNKSITKP